jgi:hypothetical protein
MDLRKLLMGKNELSANRIALVNEPEIKSKYKFHFIKILF